jgi:hypothetical protein
MTILYTFNINVQKEDIKHSAKSCNVPPLIGKTPNNHHGLINSSISKTDQEQAENKSVHSSFPIRSLFGILVDKTVVAIY